MLRCAANLTYQRVELKDNEAGTLNLKGLSPEGFIRKQKEMGEETDMQLLVANFKKFCYDFEAPIFANTSSFATEFCNKIIFEVGPDSKLKNETEKKIEWRFAFPSRNSILKRNVIVCRDKSTCSNYSEDTLVLTITQASLLALLTFGRIIELSVRKTEPVYLLTPLAAAIFPKENLVKLLNVIKLLDPGMDMICLLKIINCSCQPGGQLLPDSRADCAAVASIIATRHIKKKYGQHQTIRKTLKRYLNVGKKIDKCYFELYGRYASQKIPIDLNYNSLMNIINQ